MGRNGDISYEVVIDSHAGEDTRTVKFRIGGLASIIVDEIAVHGGISTRGR